MTIRLEVLLLALGLGLLVWHLIVPFITSIPFNMEKQWRQEYIDYNETHEPEAEISRTSISTQSQLMFCVASALIGMLVFQFKGISESSVTTVGLLIGLLLLAAINWRTSILPDALVLLYLWAGLLNSAWLGNASDGIYGAATGFVLPWLLYWSLKAGTGKEMLGYGDMKVFSVLGAWFGLSALPTVFVTCFVSWVLISIALKTKVLSSRIMETSGYIPTGLGYLVASMYWVLAPKFL